MKIIDYNDLLDLDCSKIKKGDIVRNHLNFLYNYGYSKIIEVFDNNEDYLDYKWVEKFSCGCPTKDGIVIIGTLTKYELDSYQFDKFLKTGKIDE